MRIAVTGGVAYADREHLFAVLDALHVTELAHGMAPGADTLAGEWAKLRSVPVTEYGAKWGTLQAWAGPIRNGFMLNDFEPDLLVVFSGDRGTANCFGQAKDRGIRTLLACSETVRSALVEGTDILRFAA